MSYDVASVFVAIVVAIALGVAILSVLWGGRRQQGGELSTVRPVSPVDRTQCMFTSAVPPGMDHRELQPNGQQHAYVVLTPAERAKGFVRPLRDSYVHVGRNAKFDGPILVALGEGGCGVLTRMSRDIAETYARDPYFYSGTFCCGCGKHLPLEEFVWDGTQEVVGS